MLDGPYPLSVVVDGIAGDPLAVDLAMGLGGMGGMGLAGLDSPGMIKYESPLPLE